MPFITESEVETLDPLSTKLRDFLQEKNLRIDRNKLREFVFLRARKEVLRNNPLFSETSGKKTLDNLVKIQVDLSIEKDIKSIVRQFQEIYGSDGNQTLQDKSESQLRLDAIKKNYATIFKETPEVHLSREVDKVVAVGGLTKLHIAAQRGDFAEVKKLVEVDEAKVNVRDNSKMTPRQRAEAFGHKEVATYLANFS